MNSLNSLPLEILYINVIEQNAGWGAETFINKSFNSLGHSITNIDFRKNRHSLASELLKVNKADILFLQRGDRFPKNLLKLCNRPKFFWATELVSRNRDQDALLKSNIFNHIFVHSNDCKKRVIKNCWASTDHISVMLGGFDKKLHHKEHMAKDIDILFVGSMLPRRESIIRKLSSQFHIEVCSVFGKEMSHLFNRSKIVLNIHAEEFLDTETRIYEALGCGAFVISEKLSSENPFISGKHLLEVNSIDEMKSQIEYYLKHSDERKQIALQGHTQALCSHSYETRAKEFIEIFNKFEWEKTQLPFNYRRLKIHSFFENIKNGVRAGIN